MRLQIAPDTVYMVHFHRPPNPLAEALKAVGQDADESDRARIAAAIRKLELNRPSIICYLHLGPCRNMTRPCGTVPMAKGIATCSRLDQFVKATGRKIALTKAIANAQLPKSVRAAIWHAYLFKSPPKTKHSTIECAVPARNNGESEVKNVGPIPGGAPAIAS